MIEEVTISPLLQNIIDYGPIVLALLMLFIGIYIFVEIVSAGMRRDWGR